MSRRSRRREPSSAEPEAGGSEGLLVARGVRKVYRSGEAEVVALAGLDLSVDQGEFVAVTGPSGSGKTTLLQCLSGLDDVDAGSVTVAGENVHGLSEPRRSAQRARLMGFVFQSLNLLPVFSAVENVELPLQISRVPAREARERAREALDRVGLSDRMDHRPSELSGGEQQRVAVARALVSRPALVWADEPTGSLDTTTTEEMIGLLRELHAGGTTFVLVTHNPAVAEVAERRVQMLDGTVVEDTR
ncbi:MAG: ABC transporter ATP-binding protein [Rubrobacteraceae bacterium]